MPESEVLSLSDGAQRLVQDTLQKQQESRQALPGVNHWLLTLLEHHGAMAEALAKGLSAAALEKYVAGQLGQGQTGDPLGQEMVVQQAAIQAQARGKNRIAERDLAVVILIAAGYTLADSPVPTASSGSPAQTASSVLDATPELALKPNYQPRLRQPIPVLEQFGRDVTHLAATGHLSQIVGRETEVQLMTETLCRRTKRNPLLVGPAGVGKTAIVEGLAQRIVHNEVPEALLGVRLIALQPSTLIVGGHMIGELEKRMQALLHEASQDGVILFIDEVHTLIGAGGMPGLSDLASLLKPALARGEIACIAATTDEEYRRFIEPDAALERRFQPIRVQELTAPQALTVLASLRDELVQLHHVQVGDDVLRWLVDFAHQYLRNRYFPDKGIDLLEQSVAYAVTQGKQTVEVADARVVAERLIGMPPEASAGLSALHQQLSVRTQLDESVIQRLINRLEVTTRGLDLRLTRPNAIVLLVGEAAQIADEVASVVAESLFGSADRILSIDFSRFVHPADVTLLVGAPPGYVGYTDSLPLDRLTQTPWCVVLCHNLHACHPQVREVWMQTLADGFLTNGRGKRSFLSDTVVILTAELTMPSSQPLGFQPATAAATSVDQHTLEVAIGPELLAQVDIVVTQLQHQSMSQRTWLRRGLLANMTARYSKLGLDLQWDDSLVDWLVAHQRPVNNQRGWERLLDDHVAPALIRYLPSAPGKEVTSLRIKYQSNVVQIETA